MPNNLKSKISFAAMVYFSGLSMAAAQDISGVWVGVENAGAVRSGYELTPEGERQFEYNKAGMARQDSSIDTAIDCVPTGMMRAMVGLPMVIVQSDFAVVIVAEAEMLPRVIRMNSSHREGYWPTYMGDSIGHWEGDTLVVETVNLNTNTFADQVGLPHSEELKVVERFTRLPDGNLQILMTFDDPVMFVEPWTVDMTFGPTDSFPIENACVNPRPRPEDPTIHAR